MTGELPRPEQDPRSEVRLFNIEAMSDEQVLVLFRGVAQIEDFSDALFDHRVLDELQDALSGEVRDLALTDPERLANLVRRCEQSDDDPMQTFAALVAPGLLNYDYALARDTLVSIYSGAANDRLCGEYARDYAASVIINLMNDRLTREQVADFDAKIIATGLPGLGRVRNNDADARTYWFRGSS